MAGSRLYVHLIPTMVKMINSGKSVSDISRELDIDHQTIKGYLIKEGLVETGVSRLLEGKTTVKDVERLRQTIKKGDYIRCSIETFESFAEGAIEKSIKAAVTDIFRYGVTVSSGEKGKKYRFIPYKDILFGN